MQNLRIYKSTSCNSIFCENRVFLQPRYCLISALDELYHYSLIHFAREELFADAAGFKQVPHLAHSHHKLLDELVHLKGEIDSMVHGWQPELIDHLTKFLRSWLIDHVIKEYLLIKPDLQKHSPTFDPRQQVYLDQDSGQG